MNEQWYIFGVGVMVGYCIGVLWTGFVWFRHRGGNR